MTEKEILAVLPDLEPEDIKACLAFAADREVLGFLWRHHERRPDGDGRGGHGLRAGGDAGQRGDGECSGAGTWQRTQLPMGRGRLQRRRGRQRGGRGEAAHRRGRAQAAGEIRSRRDSDRGADGRGGHGYPKFALHHGRLHAHQRDRGRVCAGRLVGRRRGVHGHADLYGPDHRGQRVRGQ